MTGRLPFTLTRSVGTAVMPKRSHCSGSCPGSSALIETLGYFRFRSDRTTSCFVQYGQLAFLK